MSESWNSSEKSLPLRDTVFRDLRRAILKGELEPGQRLMEMKLADKMGVSRTPVREAIQMLEKDGLVMTIPHKGAVVADIKDKDLKDVLEVREALEVLSVRLACIRMTEEDIDRLERANRVFKDSIMQDVIDMAEADENFHDIIYESAGNDRLLMLVQNMREQMYRFRIEHLKNIDIRPQLVEDHRELTQRLRERDVEGAENVITRHLRQQQEMVHMHLQQKNN